MSTLCPIDIGLDQDQRFQELKETYKDRNLSDYVLLMKLASYREREDLDIDWYPTTEDDYKGFTNYLDTPARTPKFSVTKESLNNLYKTLNTLYTPMMLNNRINRIAGIYSDYVTNLVKGSSFGVTRQQAIRNQATEDKNGFDVILERTFDYIKRLGTIEGQQEWYKNTFPSANEERTVADAPWLEYRAKEFAKMYDNKESLGMLAAIRIGNKERFSINVDGLQYDFSDIEDYEDPIEEEVEDDGVDAAEAQKGDRYVDYRILPIMSTLSVEARALLDKIYMRDRNGDIVRDDLGYPVVVNPKQAVIALHKTLVASTPETMEADLEKAVSRYPWIRSLLSHLRQNPDDKTLVYCTFKRARSSYYYGYKDNTGKAKVRQINNAADGRGLSREAGMNLGSGIVASEEYSFVNNTGNLQTEEQLAKIKKAIDGIAKFGKDKLPAKPVSESRTNWTVDNAARDWKERVNAVPESGFAELTKVLRGLGFVLDESDVKYGIANAAPIASITGTRKERTGNVTPQVSSIDRLVNSLNEIRNRAEFILSSEDDKTGTHLYNYAADEFGNIADIFSSVQSNEVEERSISGTKALSAATMPNALHELVDKLSNVAGLTDEQYRAMLKNDFGQYEGMSLGFGNDQVLTGWLSDFYNDGKEGSDASFKKIRKSFQVIDFTDFKDIVNKDFAKLTSAEHAAISYVMYHRGTENRTSDLSGHMYEVPIQSDYDTAYNFVVMPSHTRDELIERLAQEVECEAQRIAAIRERQSKDSKSGDPIRAIPMVYERRGVEFQIFPEMNDNGFIERYKSADAVAAHEEAKKEVAAQLSMMVQSEKDKLRNMGVFTAANKKIMGIKSEDDKNVEDWILNSFYARQQITKLMYGGLEHFKGTSDFEKRNMYSHATRLPLDTKATYRGEIVGKENQRVLYLSDDEAKSSVYELIAAVADRLLAEGKLTAAQVRQMKKAYVSITTTDGQGFRTLDSMRDVKIMSSAWSDSDEVAYQHIKSGKYGPEDVQHFIVGMKPIYTGYEILPAQEGEYQKPVRVPVLHKYSEMVLLPEMVEALGVQNGTSPLKALNKINDSLPKGKKIDLFLFGSDVKVGAHSVIDAFAKDDDGNRILKSSDEIAGFVSDKLKTGDFWIHTLPYKYYGLSSPMHADVVDENIAWATQAEKEAWGNIKDDEVLSIGGKEMKSVEARELFYRIKAARTIDSYKRLTDKFADKAAIAEILKTELANKPYQSRELLFALQMRDSGKFSYPLYSPNIQHDVVALLSSVIKKTFTKVPTSGANMIQTTSLGLDMELEGQAFEKEAAVPGFDTLELKFDKDGRFMYAEAIVPIVDSAFLQFADENGNITPARLNELVRSGVIPESSLNFIAYRTPSDAEHSVIPCRIKGFISNVGGPSIRVPREIMKMTGHDFDGDKLRCHFKSVVSTWNDRQLKSDYQRFSNTEAVQAILSTNTDPTLTPYEVFRRNATASTNPDSAKYRAVREIKYDFTKAPLDNIGNNSDYRALNNALVDLMFAQLTSEEGGLKMFIPGGCEETKEYANTIGTRGQAARNVSPFTVSHATESHDYMMEGAGMIGVYALYNSSGAMFQRLNLEYIPETDKNGDSIDVSFFGKPIGKLYPITSDGSFTSLGMSRLLNAAVDNGKEPLLGYLNQTAGLAHITNFLLAAGLEEGEVHLLLNQPVMKELARRLKSTDATKVPQVINGMLNQMFDRFRKENGKAGFYQDASVRKVSMMSKSLLGSYLDKSYSDILLGSDTQLRDQISLLQTMQHINGPARDLEQFVKLTRPEADSGGIDSRIGGTISRLIQLDQFREKLNKGEVRISGMNDVLRHRDIYENSMTPKMIEEEIGNSLPEVVALNTLMKDSVLKLLRDYFPQARESWLRVTKQIASQYSYDRIPATVVERINSDMILWKLMNDTLFITGNPQEEQKRIVEDVPEQLRSLKKRIERAKDNPGKDAAADKLTDNLFLNNLDLGTTVSAENKSISRIRFKLNGASLEDTADTVRSAWGEMLYSDDKDIQQLAKDLFKYNLYTNGFSFGRYEFARYAPASVIFSTTGYLNALNNVLGSNWAEDDAENFYNQYIMNHWGDKNFIPRFTTDKLPVHLRARLGITLQMNNPVKKEDFDAKLEGKDYIVVRISKDGKATDHLYRLIRDSFGSIVDIEEAPKLGIRNRNGQALLQYNPRIRDYREIRPIFTSNEVVWEGRGSTEEGTSEEPSITEVERQAAIDDIPFSIPITATTVKKLDDECAKSAKENGGKLTAEQAAAFGFEDEFEPVIAFKEQYGDWEPDVLYQEAKEAWNNNEYKFNYSFKPSTKLANGFASVLGHDITSVHITGDSVRHIKKQHGSEEASRGQREITAEDIPVIPYIMNNYDTIELDRNHSDMFGRAIKITKRINGISVIGTIERGKNKEYVITEWEYVKSNVPMQGNAPGPNVQDGFDETKIKNDIDNIKSFATRNLPNDSRMFYLVNRDASGAITTGYFPATPEVIEQARSQQAFHDLNERLRPLLAEQGVRVGVLEDSEARMMAGGVTDFKAAHVLVEGMAELIRIANGDEGEFALPEEFAHVALEMLGGHTVEKDAEGNIVRFKHDNPLVTRLLNALNRSDAALEEAFNGQMADYQKEYGDDNREKLVMEAAGKLVAKQLFLKQYIKTPSTKNIVQRVCDAIKAFFKNFSLRKLYSAMFGADKIASQLAQNLLSGKLADEMSLDKITTDDKFLSINKDLSEKEDLLSKMLKNTIRRQDILERRLKYSLNKGASSKSLDETKRQVAKLTTAAQKQKLEITVVDYLKDTMQFMKEMEESLDTTINNRPANAVCRKLRIVRDTMYGFASVFNDIREALSSGELEDDVNVKSVLNDIEGKATEFWKKYDRISMTYFQEFLSGVYGKDGVTVTVGKNKGKKISIDYMARKADHDISIAARFLNAVSDCDDYVLLAIDDVTREAKLNARNKVRELRPKLEAAFAAVVKEQGNRDQSWMFKRTPNGKRVGTYISEAEAKQLSPAKQEFYKVFMELKALGDACCPQSLVSPLKMIMFRKQHYEKMKEAQGLRGKATEEWEAAKRSVLEMGDVDFENEVVIKDFEDNIVDQLPLKFLNKGMKESYDDMSEDAASSLMAYLGMAFEYREMNNVIGILENARYMSSKRDVQQKRGFRNLITTAGTEKGLHYTEPYTVKQAHTRIQACMNDFFQMHIYGHLQKDEGTIGKTRISRRKATNLLTGYTSLAQMALNIHQRIANVNTGFTQIVVESAGGKIKAKDVAWASSIWVAQSGDRLADTGKTDYDNKLSLWLDKFDIHQDNGDREKNAAYGKDRASKVFNSNLLYAGLSIGEDFLSATTALAFARKVKLVGPDGKTANLWDAYEVKYVDEKNKTGAYLEMKPGYKKEDGSDFTFEDEKKFSKEVIATNFELQGIYNKDDRSAIQQHSLGALAIMYRKWIAPAMKRRYSGARYNKLKDEYTEGYYVTSFNLAKNVIKDWFAPRSEEECNETIFRILTDMKALRNAARLNWAKMTDYEKGNWKKAMRELSVMGALILASGLLKNLPPDDNDNKFISWAEDLALTQLLRLRSEIGSQAPTPMMANEALRILSSPFAAMRPLTDTLNAFQLLWIPNYTEEVQSGRYAGHTKAHKYFMKLPVVSLFRKFDNVIDPSPLLNYYKNQNY